MNKTYYVVTVPHSNKLSIAEKMTDAEETAECWRQEGFSTLIEIVQQCDLTKTEREWLGVS